METPANRSSFEVVQKARRRRATAIRRWLVALFAGLGHGLSNVYGMPDWNWQAWRGE